MLTYIGYLKNSTVTVAIMQVILSLKHAHTHRRQHVHHARSYDASTGSMYMLQQLAQLARTWLHRKCMLEINCHVCIQELHGVLSCRSERSVTYDTGMYDEALMWFWGASVCMG